MPGVTRAGATAQLRQEALRERLEALRDQEQSPRSVRTLRRTCRRTSSKFLTLRGAEAIHEQLRGVLESAQSVAPAPEGLSHEVGRESQAPKERSQGTEERERAAMQLKPPGLSRRL